MYGQGQIFLSFFGDSLVMAVFLCVPKKRNKNSFYVNDNDSHQCSKLDAIFQKYGENTHL